MDKTLLISQNATGQGGDDYTIGSKTVFKFSKILATDLSKQQALDVDLKALQKINFTRNLDQDGDGDTALYLGKECVID